MTTFAPGALVKDGSFGDAVWVVRASAGRPNHWHLFNKVAGRLTPITKVARESTLKIIAPAPLFKVGDVITYNGRQAMVMEDLGGDQVKVVVGFYDTDANRADLVLERINGRK
jgi:hypothetical protein